MEKPALSFPLEQRVNHNTRWWVALVAATLAISGIGPLILVAGRASRFAETDFIKNAFADALVVHVDLSAVAWFLGICLLFWGLAAQEKRLAFVQKASMASFGAGVVAIALSPVVGGGVSLFSNYIPVYTSALFHLGVGFMAASLVLGLVHLCVNLSKAEEGTARALKLGITGSGVIIAVALAHFIWAYTRLDLPPAMTPDEAKDYYELLFWAGGHVLQLAYTQLLLVAWLWLARKGGVTLCIPQKLLYAAFLIYPLVALASPLAFLNGSEPYDLHFFTMQMRHGGGLGTTVLGLVLLAGLIKAGLPAKENRLYWVMIVSSFVVFLVGGVIGFTIDGVNTIIPAHYHGSIVGTTLAFMGVVYAILPRIGWADVSRWKTALIQPLLYGGGSILHAFGFAIAGSYGAERKAVGAMENAHPMAQFGLKLIHHGGGLAIIGGGLFVYVVWKAYRKRVV